MIRKVLSLAAVIAFASCAAWAQQIQPTVIGDGYGAPALEVHSAVIPYLYAGAALLAICASVFKNARRSHLD